MNRDEEIHMRLMAQSTHVKFLLDNHYALNELIQSVLDENNQLYAELEAIENKEG